jgi:urea transport system ATP-binding protein
LLLVDEPAAGMIRALDVRVTVLHEGSVLAEGQLDAVQNNQRVIDVYLGR